jgi:hypothetical protein
METTNKNIQIGCVTPLSVIVFLAFFFAKIYDKIDWSWWWVFSPLWIPISLVIIFLLVMLILKIWIG